VVAHGTAGVLIRGRCREGLAFDGPAPDDSMPHFFKMLRFVLLASLLMPQALLCATNTDAASKACQFSETTFSGDAALMLRQSPTRFRLMASRYVSMIEAQRGYNCTGTATVSFDGHRYTQAGRSDDPGLMELIPAISRFTGLSLINSYDGLILALILSGFSLGYAGFLRLHLDRRARLIGSFVFLCIAIAEARVADEYVFQIAPLVAVIPWLLHLGSRQSKIALPVCASLLALVCSFCAIVRSGSAIICLTFLIALFLARYRIQRPFLPILLVLLSCLPSLFFTRSLIARRNASLHRIGGSALTVDSHPIWHTLYIGLGFIPNSEVPEYLDEVADKRVRSIDPTATYTSARYQAILKHELWDIFRRRPLLVFGIVAAKTGVVIVLALILLFPARHSILTDRSRLWIDIPFLLTIAMSGMNGIVAVPRASYLLTFFCLAFLYTTIKLLESHGASSSS
jgi:hypothetical protein